MIRTGQLHPVGRIIRDVQGLLRTGGGGGGGGVFTCFTSREQPKHSLRPYKINCTLQQI